MDYNDGDHDSKSTSESTTRSTPPKIKKRREDIRNDKFQLFSDALNGITNLEVKGELKGKIEMLLDNYAILVTENESLQQDKKSLQQDKAFMEKDMTNANYLKYCIIARNEIEKFDSYAYETKPMFQPPKSDEDYFADYYSWKEEKRRLRWLYIFRYSSRPEVQLIKDNLPPKFTTDSFAGYISKAFRLLSQEIHNLCYTMAMKEQYCPTITSDKLVNECINVVMSNVEMNVGKMVSRAPPYKKVKPNPDTSLLGGSS